ncbi:MAG: helix-turn-helix domain-containing protein [candidate division WOR-3 bacterium]
MFLYKGLYNKMNKEARFKLRVKMIEDYNQGKTISQISREYGVSRNTLRKWIKRYKEKGEEGLKELSRKPHNLPKEIQEKILEIRRKTNWGRERIALRLKLNEWTVRNVLRQNGIRKKRKERKGFFSAFWSWEIKEPFSHAQVDTKDILNKATLGTELYQKFSLLKLPRYQWTFCESISRFRFLGYSYRIS